jgi:hypothetical protein
LAPQLLCFKVVDAYFIENVKWFYFSWKGNTIVAAFEVVETERTKKFLSGPGHKKIHLIHLIKE